MPRNGVRGVTCDTGFWIAAFDPKEDQHARALELFDDLAVHNMLIPWPITYEVLRTRMVRKPRMVSAFGRVLRLPAARRIDDASYRDACLEDTLNEAQHGHRPLSLVDRVVRAMLQDTTYRIVTFCTFNASDFHDVCLRRRIEIWPASPYTRSTRAPEQSPR